MVLMLLSCFHLPTFRLQQRDRGALPVACLA